jgi:hypothetical protein
MDITGWADTCVFDVGADAADCAALHGRALRALGAVIDAQRSGRDFSLPRLRILASLSPAALALARSVCSAAYDDPGQPSLESDFVSCVAALSCLVSALSSVCPRSRVAPDPADPVAEEYLRVRACLLSLLAAGRAAHPTWRLLRSLSLSSRGRPPSRAARGPLLDDKEYYVLLASASNI